MATVYTGSGDNTARRVTAEGTEVWSASQPDSVNAVAYVPDGELGGPSLYLGLANNRVRLVDIETGSSLFFRSTGSTVNGVAADATDHYYSTHADNTARKYAPNGVEVWTHNLGGTGRSIAVGADGFVYVGSNANAAHKLDPDGAEVWTFTGHTNNVAGIAVDPSGFVYTASTDDTVRKLDPDGDEVWTFTGHTGNVNTVETSAGRYGAFPDEWQTFPPVYVGGDPVVAAYLGALQVTDLTGA